MERNDRAGGRHHRRLHRAADGRGQVLDALDLVGPFGPRPGRLDHLAPEDRLLQGEAAVLLPGGHHQRRALAEGVVEHPHGVSQAAADVQVDHAAAARRLGVAVGDGHGRHLLQGKDVLQAAIGDQGIDQRQLGRAGIAEQIAHAAAGQQFQHRFDAAGDHACRPMVPV